MTTYTATYSPEDNKLRLYASTRLDAETYAEAKRFGFRWAPKQDLFVAPMWTPEREDFLLSLCEELGDEDTSLVDRQEARAERFETYSDNRAQDAEQAYNRAEELAGGIPLGQPILVGHHSEKRARKMAQKIDNETRRAVNMWETSRYWQQRATGALHHAKYKELPAVRARRIKTIEADRRKRERTIAEAEKCLKLWRGLHDENILKRKDGTPSTPMDKALFVSNYLDHSSFCFTLTEYPRDLPASQYEGQMSLWSALTDGVISPDQAAALVVPRHERTISRCNRWLQHYDNRLTYEKAMLEEQGAAQLLEKKPAPKQLPLLNYRAPGGKLEIPSRYHAGQIDTYTQVDMTKAEYSAINSDYKGTRVVGGNHRVRTAMQKYSLVAVFLTDSKVHDIPEMEAPAAEAATAPKEFAGRTHCAPRRDTEETKFDALKSSMRNGSAVQTVSANQLFPTPPALAHRVIQLAYITPGMRVLEPSAGTGSLLEALPCVRPDGEVVAVEINAALCKVCEPHADRVVNGDFLSCLLDDLGQFDRIVMNPPFENGADIAHIMHAKRFLKPGGVLVAICANGPRQQRDLQPLCDMWEPLEPGSFKSSGTNVNAAICVITE